ncbi:hypothetical protein JCM3766R1_005521 [Sporobolomyces carnicolor]
MSANPFDAIRSSFTDRFDESAHISFSIQAAVLVGLSILVAILSSSVVVRLVKKTGHFWTIEENGIFHFGESMISQLLCGVYSVLQLVFLSGYLSNSYSNKSHITLQFLSPLVLYLSLLVLLHSLVIQFLHNPLLRPFPGSLASLADEWNLSQVLKRRQARRRSNKINAVSLFAVFVLMIAPFTATLATVRRWHDLLGVLEEAVRWADSIEASRSSLSSIKYGELQNRGLEAERKLVSTIRLWCGFWMAMLAICLVISASASFHLVSILRQRRKSLRRALSHLQNGSVSTFNDAASKAGIDTSVLATERRQEIQDRLVSTERGVRQSTLRFVLTSATVASYFALLAWSTRHFYPDSSSLFVLTLWSAWSITPVSLVCSLVFAFHTFFSRLPVLRQCIKSRRSPAPTRMRGGHDDSVSQRGLTDEYDSRSIASSTFTSYPPSSFHSRGTSFVNVNLPSYDPVSTYRARSSYPPPPPSKATPSDPPSLSRANSRTTLSAVGRKAVPISDDDGGRTSRAEDSQEEAQSSSHHGSIWKEQLR